MGRRKQHHDPFGPPGEPPGGFLILFPLMLFVVVIAGLVYEYREAIIAFFKVLFMVLFGIGVLVGLAWCIREIRKIQKVQQEDAVKQQTYLAEAHAAFTRVKDAYWFQWPVSNTVAMRKMAQLIKEYGFNHTYLAITTKRVEQLLADIHFCLQVWPNDQELLADETRARELLRYSKTYEKALMAYERHDLACAWRLVNHLPLPFVEDQPNSSLFLQFFMLWGIISREFYPRMVTRFPGDQLSFYLFDALGIETPRYLLDEAARSFAVGQRLSGQPLEQVRNLHQQMIRRSHQLNEWGNEWTTLLQPHIEEVVSGGFEDFVLYFTGVAVKRPYKEYHE